MNKEIEKYKYWQEYLTAAQIDLKAALRIVDAMLEIVHASDNNHSNPELCAEIQNLADRLRFFITSRMVALDDLILILETHGIRGVLPGD